MLSQHNAYLFSAGQSQRANACFMQQTALELHGHATHEWKQYCNTREKEGGIKFSMYTYMIYVSICEWDCVMGYGIYGILSCRRMSDLRTS